MRTYRWLCIVAFSLVQMGCLWVPGGYGGDGRDGRDGGYRHGQDERYEGRPDGSAFRPGDRERVNATERVGDGGMRESGLRNGWMQ
ncbi:MAG TPA: hypothetical protein VM659_07460 [Dongiaceae bacterium]|nr:hypothetical protein [Dongiaceae bacterium]